jgi:hypothetical protein
MEHHCILEARRDNTGTEGWSALTALSRKQVSSKEVTSEEDCFSWSMYR